MRLIDQVFLPPLSLLSHEGCVPRGSDACGLAVRGPQGFLREWKLRTHVPKQTGLGRVGAAVCQLV